MRINAPRDEKIRERAFTIESLFTQPHKTDKTLNNALHQKLLNRRNSIWGIVDYAAQAVSLICLTPLLLKHLGDSAFGLFVVGTTVMGLSGMFSLGLGPASQHFISKYRNCEKSRGRLKSIVETSLISNAFFGILSCVAVTICAGLISLTQSPEPETSSKTLTSIVQLASLGLPFVFVVNAVDNSLKGFERFELSVPLSAMTRLGIAATQIALVLLDHSVESLIITTVVFRGFQAIAGTLALKRWAIPELSLIPSFSKTEFRGFLSYGVYAWLNSMIVTAYNSGEIMMLALILGPTALTVYAVPTRVLSQVHLLLASAFAFLFPFATKLIHLGDTQKVYTTYSKSTRYLCTLSGLAIPTIVLACGPLLAIWVGEDRARQIQPIFQILALRYSVFPLSILTSNLLMAAGKTRAMTIISSVNTLTILPFSGALAYLYGVKGAAAAQLLVLAPILFNRFFIEKTLFKVASLRTTCLPILLLVGPLAGLLMLVHVPVTYPLFTSSLIAIGAGVTCGCICWVGTGFLPQNLATKSAHDIK